MYKTVRHGENSLQYTILPQTEEVLSNSGLKGKGRDYSPSIHVRRSRRKSQWKYTIVLIIALIIAFALLCLPLYFLNTDLIDRWFRTDDRTTATIAPAAPASRMISKSHRKELKISPKIIATLESRYEVSPASTTTTYAPTVFPLPTVSSSYIDEKSTSPPWIIPALKSWKSSTTIQTIPTEGNEIPVINNANNKQNLKEKSYIDNMSIKPWEKDIIIRPTITPETITLSSVLKYYSKSYLPTKKPATAAGTKIFDDVLISTKATTTMIPLDSTSERSKLKDLKDAMLSVDDDDEFKESLEVDEVFSLPPSNSEGEINTDSDEVTVSKADGGWYGARWPFVDTSSYFQWTGYSPGDNLLLPLLVAALSSVALVLLLALAVRRRKRTHSVTAQIGKLTSELQADDNTNLLTAENGEEVEE